MFYISTSLLTPGAVVLLSRQAHADLFTSLTEAINRRIHPGAIYAVERGAKPFEWVVQTMAAPPPKHAPPLFCGRFAFLVLRNLADPFQFWNGLDWAGLDSSVAFRPEHREALAPPPGGEVVRLGDLPLWLVEFPAFKPADMPAVPAVFTDESYQNDVSPSFYWDEMALSLWVDHADPAEREAWADVTPARFRLYSQPRDADGAPLADDWPVIAESDDWQAILAAMIGEAFAHNLRADLTPDQWEAMRQSNRTAGPDVCASHDFCDANVPMYEAFEAVKGYGISSAFQEADCVLWGQAWNHAKTRYLTAPDGAA